MLFSEHDDLSLNTKTSAMEQLQHHSRRSSDLKSSFGESVYPFILLYDKSNTCMFVSWYVIGIMVRSPLCSYYFLTRGVPVVKINDIRSLNEFRISLIVTKSCTLLRCWGRYSTCISCLYSISSHLYRCKSNRGHICNFRFLKGSHVLDHL